VSDFNKAVTVVDVQMPFMSLVVFFVKLLIVAIPAMIISTVILSVLWAILIGVFGALFGLGRMFYLISLDPQLDTRRRMALARHSRVLLAGIQ